MDVAFMELWNDRNDKFLGVIDQVRPRVVIPTHISDLETLRKAAARWPGYRRSQNDLAIAATALPKRTSLLLLGAWAEVYGRQLPLAQWRTGLR